MGLFGKGIKILIPDYSRINYVHKSNLRMIHLSQFCSDKKSSERKGSSPSSEQRLSTMNEEDEHTSDPNKKTTTPNNLSQV